MPATTRSIFAFLTIVAMLLASLPVGAIAMVGGQLADDTCCSEESSCESSSETNDSEPLEDDCCTSGCDTCFLQCCNGPLSLNAFSVTLTADHSSFSTSSVDDSQGLLTHPRAVYHPPRR